MTEPEVGGRLGPSFHSEGLERNVFSMKPRREERRQKVLDELPELDPAARRKRLDLAVAAGDVRQDEVESALRLVERLDALRVFTIPSIGAPPHAEAAASGKLAEIVPGATRAKSPARPSRRKPVAVPIGFDPGLSRRRPASAALPMDALEAASRLVARDRSARRRGEALPSRRGRDRAVPVGATAMSLRKPTPINRESAPESPHDESWPSIDWLRP